MMAAAAIGDGAQAQPAAEFSEDGALKLPGGYREWVFLGATVSPQDLNFGSAYSPGIKHTYMDPAGFAHWKKTGAFRTGTVIVQERLATEATEFMNAKGYFAGKYRGLQAMVRDPDRYPESVWGFFSFGGPPYAEKVRPVPGMGELDCAGCHAYADQDWVFTRFYPMLAAAAPEESSGAKALFERDWTPAGAEADSTDDGLGPLYNARSCSACHSGGGRGRFTVRADGVIEGDGLLLKIGRGARGDPAYGGQIQTRALPGLRPEGVPAVRFEAVADPSGASLRKPEFEVRDPGYGALDPATRVGGRVAPALFGSGALEKVLVEALEALADEDDGDGDGVSGRLNRIELPSGRAAVGRFGWKAGQPSLERQTASAFRIDFGLSSKLMGSAWGDCTPVQADCRSAPTGERAGRDGREVSTKTIGQVAAHVAALAVPDRLGDAPEGERVFAGAGCAACHAPQLPLAGGGTVRAFTDLLLHDMGEGLADGIGEGLAMGSEWRTAPLMGLGRLIENRTPLLHDGRARDAAEAILWHGGEAQSAADDYRGLGPADRRALHRFLGTL